MSAGTPVLPASVTEIVPGRLYAFGGVVPAGRPTSWYPERRTGWLPINGYLLKDRGHGLLVDTGVTQHQSGIREALSVLLADCTRRGIVMTRREPDAIVNLPWIANEFALDTVSCGGEISPIDFFESVETLTARAHVLATSGMELNWARPGAIVAAGDVRVEVLRTSLRVLATNHLYEHSTRTLFGSDAWGLLTLDAPDGPLLATADEGLDAEDIADFLAVKFDWLMGAELDIVIRDIASIGTDRPIARICSSYGRVIEGEGLVAKVLERTVKALELLSSRPRKGALGSFRWAG